MKNKEADVCGETLFVAAMSLGPYEYKVGVYKGKFYNDNVLGADRWPYMCECIRIDEETQEVKTIGRAWVHSRSACEEYVREYTNKIVAFF